MNTNKKNRIIISFIVIFGIGTFVLFFSIFNNQNSTTSKSSITKINDSSVASPIIMEPMKPVRQIPPPNTTVSVPQVEPVLETSISTPPSNVTQKSSNIYKDGTYDFSLSYRVPAGNMEKVASTITLTNDTVTVVKNSNEANNRTSREYQADFEAKIQAATIGKKIDSLNLDAVGGASLTTKAFVQGISQIQSQAKI